ncbi:hypothetical protein [Ramlibacter sp. WS9]|uniref:hypothetical protein n=1 Tax=Ramlibacter sp. WS9 TaxID=1882741 RepID=UPI0011446C1E|nr:hypothetical protein [Ramlibacter sp. WS9]ROZ72154.1 hypothetical protein EEB15_20530 [Ramlibacter sp. WS9]
MSDAGDRLARTRLAIIAQVQRRGRGNRDDGAAREHRAQDRQREHAQDGWTSYEEREWEEREGIAGWFAHARRALRTWWRHHPAHMGVELATPVLSNYAYRKPVQYLAIAAAVGAVVVVARPWRLITVGGLLAAVLKSSQVSTLVMSALSAADFQKDQRRPYE